LRPWLVQATRGTWLKYQAKNFDVLITNVRLVEMGLNLTMFSTAIFGELEWSLYVIWQAMRRLWRPGAPKPVKVLFPVYEGTLEEQMINLIGAKMRAASLFYGDEVGSALVEEEDEASLLQDLVRTALSDAPVGRAETIFGKTSAENFMSESPMGSLVAPSPTLMSLTWEQAKLMLKNRPATRSRNGQKAKSGALAQPSLLDLLPAND